MMDAGSAVLTVWLIIAAVLAASWSWRIQDRRESKRPKRVLGARSTDGGNRPRHSNDVGNVWD